MTAILLINLLIARMSNSFQRISDQSQREWAYERAKLVQNLTLIREKPVWNILPAPLNLFPIICTLGGLLDANIRTQAKQRQLRLFQQQQEGMVPDEEDADGAYITPAQQQYISLRGTVANITLFFVYFPCAKVLEVLWAFVYAFVLPTEEPMSVGSFLRLVLDTIFYLVIYVPLFTVEIVRSLRQADWALRPWISHVTLQDEYLVPKRHVPPPLPVEHQQSHHPLSPRMMSEDSNHYSPASPLPHHHPSPHGQGSTSHLPSGGRFSFRGSLSSAIGSGRAGGGPTTSSTPLGAAGSGARGGVSPHEVLLAGGKHVAQLANEGFEEGRRYVWSTHLCMSVTCIYSVYLYELDGCIMIVPV